MNVKKKCGVMRNDSVAGNKKTLPYLPFFFFLPVCEDWTVCGEKHR